MHSSLSVCAASCGLHAREGEEGTLKDMPCNETKVMFVAETRDLKLEPSTCTVSLPFVETPMAGIRGKEKRAPLKTRDATRENESSLLKLELNTCTVPLAFVEYPVACMRAKAKKAPLKTCHTTRQKKCLFLKLEFKTEKKDVVTKIRELMLDFNLVDIWRLRNPDKKRYTWKQNKQRRHR